MHLLPDERVLTESAGGGISLTLTNQRVQYEAQSWGQAEITTIMLEQIASCALVKQSKPILLVLAGLVLLLTAYFGLQQEIMLAWIGVGVVLALLVAYAATSVQVLMIASAGAKIVVNAAALPTDQAAAFLQAVAQAQHQRYLLGRTAPGAPEGPGGLPAALGRLSGQLAAVISLTEELGKDAKASQAQVAALAESTRAIAIMLHRELAALPGKNGVGRH